MKKNKEELVTADTYLHLSLFVTDGDEQGEVDVDLELCEAYSSIKEVALATYEIVETKRQVGGFSTIRSTVVKEYRDIDIKDNLFVDCEIDNSNEHAVIVKLHFKTGFTDFSIDTYDLRKDVVVELAQYNKRIIVGAYTSASVYIHKGEVLEKEKIDILYNSGEVAVREEPLTNVENKQ